MQRSTVRTQLLHIGLLIVVTLFTCVGHVTAQTSAPAARAAKADVRAALLAAGKTAGTMNVIVELALPYAYNVEGDLLSTQAVEEQRTAIATEQTALLTSMASMHVVDYARFKTIPYLAVTVDEAALTALVNSEQVRSIQEDTLVPATLASSTKVIGAPRVWTAGYQGAGQTVAVLDSGIDAGHPFFNNRVIDQACFSNAGGKGKGQTLCTDGQAVQSGGSAADANTALCLNNNQQICAHGSHVAGIVAGSGTAFSGVAPRANILAIQVFTRFNDATICDQIGRAAPCVGTYTSDYVKALDWLGQYKASQPTVAIAAVNLSLGGGSYTDQTDCDTKNAATKAVIDNLRSQNIATIIAAGNAKYTNALGAPACISSAVAVGATDDQDNVAEFSNMHEMVDLLAPGVNIESSIPGSGFVSYNGTSMAAPMVAGAWAILKSIHPNATVSEILQQLSKTGVPVKDKRAGGAITKPRLQLDVANADPQLVALQPDNSAAGASLTVTIVATNTHFVANTTTVHFGADITIDSVTVKSPTEVAVALQIASTAQLGPRTVKVTTGAEVIAKADSFLVTGNPLPPTINTITPANGTLGQSITVNIIGANTHFVSGKTAANFGDGITVNQVTVKSATEAAVTLTIAAAAELGERTIQLTTGAEIVTKEKTFRVDRPTIEKPTLYFDPAVVDLKVGDTYTMNVVIAPGLIPINGVQIHGKLDPTYLQLLNVKSNNTVFSEVLDPLRFDTATGAFRFSAGILGATITEPFTVLTVAVKALAPTPVAGTPLQFLLDAFPPTNITNATGNIMEEARNGRVQITTVGSTATLHGRIDLQGRTTKPAPAWAIPLTVTLQADANSTPLVYQVTTDEQGAFTITGLPPGLYTVRIKSNHTLGNQINNVQLNPDDNDRFLGRLLEGDVETAHSNNQTVLADFGQLSGAFNRCAGDAGYLPNADLDEQDDCVTITDYGLLSANYNTQGWIVISSPSTTALPLPLTMRSARLTFDQATQATPVNNALDLPLYVDPANGEAVVGLTAHLHYDPSVIEIISATVNSTLKTLLKPTLDASTGSLRFSVAALPGQNINQKLQIATVRLRLKTETNGTLLALVSGQPRDTDIAGANGSIMATAEGITLTSAVNGVNTFKLYLPTINR